MNSIKKKRWLEHDFSILLLKIGMISVRSMNVRNIVKRKILVVKQLVFMPQKTKLVIQKYYMVIIVFCLLTIHQKKKTFVSKMRKPKSSFNIC